jgi:transposase-like protein
MSKKVKRYSESFRRQVVSEYESGSSIPELQRRYGINGSMTIPGWIRKYGREGFRHELVRIQTADEVQRVKELEKQVKELQGALGQMTLEKLKLESIVEVLQEDREEVLKKNARASSRSSSPKPAGCSEGR